MLLFYYCWYSEVSLKKLTKCWKREAVNNGRARRDSGASLDDSDDGDDAALKLRMQHFWILGALVLLIVVIFAIGALHVWKLFSGFLQCCMVVTFF